MFGILKNLWSNDFIGIGLGILLVLLLPIAGWLYSLIGIAVLILEFNLAIMLKI